MLKVFQAQSKGNETKILLPALFLQRAMPANIVPADKHLFEQQLTATCWDVKLEIFNNVTVNQELFLKEGFRWRIHPVSFGDHWQVPLFNSTFNRAKSFVKDRLRTNRYFDRALWCFDTFSTGGYFHWLTEILPRLWLARDHVPPEVPLLVPEYFFTKWGFVADLLRPFNRTVIHLRSSELAVVKKLFFITPPGGPLNYQEKSLFGSRQLLIDHFLDPAYSTAHERIFISRNKTGKRMIDNEAELIPLLQAFGYKVLHLEEIPVRDQVNLFTRARVIISLHGAGLTNMIFMTRGGVVGEIRHRHKDHMINCFFTLANAVGHRYLYALGNDSSEPRPTERRPIDKSVTCAPADFRKLLMDAEALLARS